MSKEKSETALAKIDSFPLIAMNPREATELIRHNMGGQMTVSDLPRIKVPGAGSKAFEIPRLDGDMIEKTFECFLIYRRETVNKAYWPSSEITGDPPVCTSDDGISGRGDPGGPCSECQYNKFGSALDSKGNARSGKACRDVQMIFPLLAGDRLPYVFALPPTSIPNFKKYAAMLSQQGIPYYTVVTEIGLTGAKSKGGTDYSQATFKVAKDNNGKLAIINDPERIAAIRKMVYGGDGQLGLSSQLERLRPTVEDYSGGNE